MVLRLGDIAPDFTADSTQGKINLYDYMGNNWLVLFSHPRDFTPVCTTELGAIARLKPEFDERRTKILALSIDSLESHAAWVNDIEETQSVAIGFPMISDVDRRVANLYGMIHPNTADNHTVRSVFVIGPDREVKLLLTYPSSTGRNFPELLRTLDSLQRTELHKVGTPADWTPGEDVVLTLAISDAEAADRFPECRAVKPYLRYTPDPGVDL